MYQQAASAKIASKVLFILEVKHHTVGQQCVLFLFSFQRTAHTCAPLQTG